jgi:FkbM family methyltransferase
LRVPGAKTLVRRLLRLVTQHSSLSFKNRQRLYNFFAFQTAPSQPVACAVRTPRGARLHMSLHLDDWISSQLYYWAYTNYERPVTRLFDQLLDQATCVIDIGANIGYYTLLAASHLRHGTVHAFEPWPMLFDRLASACRANRFDHVIVNQAALSDSDGVLPLYLPTASETDAHLTNASVIPGFITSDRRIDVSTMRFDNYCARRGVTRPDLVKIDAEGAELSILHGFGDLLCEWKPDLIVEVLEPYAGALQHFFLGTPYKPFLITDEGLTPATSLRFEPSFRDYYFTCKAAPSLSRLPTSCRGGSTRASSRPRPAPSGSM